MTLRWKLALLCATLTFLILLCFAAVLGSFVGSGIRSEHRGETLKIARALARSTDVGIRPTVGGFEFAPRISTAGARIGSGEVVEVHRVDGRLIAANHSALGLGLGPFSPRFADTVRTIGGFEVAVVPVPASSGVGPPEYFVRFARPFESAEDSVARLWLFLAIGVAAGSALALLAGLTVSRQAIRPIASLSGLARRIASTQAPSERAPDLHSDDEVADLATSMNLMLDSWEHARNEREEAFRRERDFVADASHELKTPLTAIQANLQMLEAESPQDREAVAAALASTRRMSALITDLLELARIEARGDEAEGGHSSARTVVDRAIRELGPLLEGRELTVDVPTELEVAVPEGEALRILVNLLENASSHTPPGARIGVEAVESGERDVLLRVTDGGPGLPEGMEGKVFGRFCQAEGPADTASGRGTGLGLSIVRALARSHGGDATARNLEHGGACFEVVLPRSDGVEPAPRKADEA